MSALERHAASRARGADDERPSISESAPPPRVIDALVRAVEAGQRLVLARLDVLRFELTRLLGGGLQGAALIIAGALLIAAAWAAAMVSAALWLHAYVSLPTSIAAVAAVTAALGAMAIAVGLRVARRAGETTANANGQAAKSHSDRAEAAQP